MRNSKNSEELDAEHIEDLEKQVTELESELVDAADAIAGFVEQERVLRKAAFRVHDSLKSNSLGSLLAVQQLCNLILGPDAQTPPRYPPEAST